MINFICILITKSVLRWDASKYAVRICKFICIMQSHWLHSLDFFFVPLIICFYFTYRDNASNCSVIQPTIPRLIYRNHNKSTLCILCSGNSIEFYLLSVYLRNTRLSINSLLFWKPKPHGIVVRWITMEIYFSLPLLLNSSVKFLIISSLKFSLWFFFHQFFFIGVGQVNVCRPHIAAYHTIPNNTE